MSRTAFEYIKDVLNSCDSIREFTRGMSLGEFIGDDMIRSAVEYKVVIISIALNKALQQDTDLTVAMKNTGRFIQFGNGVLKMTTLTAPEIIWNYIKDDLPTLERETEQLLNK